MLSFGIISSSASTGGAGVGNFDYFAPTGNDYKTFTFGGGTAVTVRTSGGSGVMGYASNLTSAITAGQTVGVEEDVVFGNGIFHAVGNLDERRIVYSTNATSWATALAAAATGDNIKTVGFGNGLWVAPVWGDNDVYTSASGTAFTEQAGVLASGSWSDVTWNGSVFGVYNSANRDNGGGGTAYYTSTNGTTWTARTLPALPRTNLAVGSGVVMYVGPSAVVYTSATGTAFAIAGTAPQSLSSVAAPEIPSLLEYGAGIWLYAGKPFGGGTVVSYYSSDNGVTWGTATFGTPVITSDSFDLAFNSSDNSFYMTADAGATTDVYKASVIS